jgi:shikimate dehydrogenase
VKKDINGSTRLAGVIGWPIEHSLSPAMHNAAYARLGLDWAYLPLPVRESADVPAVVTAIRSLPFVGFNVTMPYKQMMVGLCDEVAAQAELCGAVNTVQVVDGRLLGYNTDGRGLLESLRDEAGFEPQGKRAVVLGSGGAAGAIAAALVLAGVSHLTIVSRDPAHADGLIARLTPHARDTELTVVRTGDESAPLVQAADLVVNSTPLGLRPGDPSPVHGEWLHSGQVVSDMIYSPPNTPFLRDAEAAGAKALGGLGMLVAQGAISLEIWNGDSTMSAPRDVMRDAAHAALLTDWSEEDEAEEKDDGGDDIAALLAEI